MTHAHWGQHLYYHQKNTLSLLKPKRGNAGERCLRQREVYLPQGVPLGQRSGGRWITALYPLRNYVARPPKTEGQYKAVHCEE